MNGARLSRKIHKWLSLAVGLQLLLWSLSGFYMVAVRIDIIHGDMLVKNSAQPIDLTETNGIPLGSLLKRFPGATGVALENMAGVTVLRIATPDGQHLVNPRSGELVSPLDAASALAVARYHYAGSGEPATAELIESDPPGEIRFIPLPVWRVDFDDQWGTSFYIQPDSGRLASRRHTLWRMFDFLWMLHIMDYDERENVNNTLLQVASLLALVFAISGTWLLLYSFRRQRQERRS